MQSLLEVALFAKPMYPPISRPTLPPPRATPTLFPVSRKPDAWPLPPRYALAPPSYEPEHYDPECYEPKRYEPERDADYAPSPIDAWLARKIDWIIHEVKPLSALLEFGQVLQDGGLKARLVIAIICGLGLLLSVLGPSDFLPWWAALGTGGIAGALITPALGRLVQFIVRFFAYALFFIAATIAAGAVLAFIALLLSAVTSAH